MRIRTIRKEHDSHFGFQNEVKLDGIVRELRAITNIFGIPFSGYMGKINISRTSNYTDEVTIAFEENIFSGMDEFDVLKEFSATKKVSLTGKIQSLRDSRTGRVLIYILVEHIELSANDIHLNDIFLVGELAGKPVYRVTPKGKRIADMFIKVPNMLRNNFCYIPCICWQEMADEIINWQRGERIQLSGRYQSREYSKFVGTNNNEKIWERRTVYELSINELKKLEKTEENTLRKRLSQSGDIGNKIGYGKYHRDIKHIKTLLAHIESFHEVFYRLTMPYEDSYHVNTDILDEKSANEIMRLSTMLRGILKKIQVEGESRIELMNVEWE